MADFTRRKVHSSYWLVGCCSYSKDKRARSRGEEAEWTRPRGRGAEDKGPRTKDQERGADDRGPMTRG